MQTQERPLPAVYLLYTPDPESSRAFDADTLKHLETEPAKSITLYAEKLWLDPDVLRPWQRDHGKIIRPRLLPTQLR